MTAVDDLVGDYLSRLEAAAASLPPDRRAELLSEIGDHITDARAAGAAADEAAVRTLLDRLGSPSEIVAAAHEDVAPGWAPSAPGDAAGWDGAGSGWYGNAGPAAPPAAARPRGTGHELAAVLLLTAGSFVPVAGWLVGVVLLWTSSLWRVREKLLGTLVVPFGPAVALYGAVLPLGGVEVCSSTGDVVHSEGGPFGPAPGTALPPEPGGAPPPPQPLPEPLPPDVGMMVCEGSGVAPWVGLPVAVALLVAPVVVAVVLFRIAQRRAAQAPLTAPDRPHQAISPWGPVEISAVAVLGLGSLLLPVVPLLVGLLLVCLSPRWTPAVKLVVGVLALSATAGVVAFYVTADPLGFGGLGVYALSPVTGLLAATLLVVQLQRRT